MSHSGIPLHSALATLVACVLYGSWYAMSVGVFGFVDGVLRGVLFDVVAKVVLPVTALLVLYKISGLRPRDYWMVSPFAKRRISEVVALVFISTVLLLTYVIVANLVAPREFVPDERIESRRDLGTIAALSVILYLSAAASFSEEIFYRALPRLIFGAASTAVGTIAYVLTSSIFFGLMHLSYGTHSAISAGYFGFVAALILIWTNNLWYPLIGHFLSDVLIMWWRFAKYGVLSV